MTILSFFLFLLSNSLCLANGAIIVSFMKWRNNLEKALSIGMLWCIQVFCTLVLCGLFGLLHKPYLITVTLFLFFLILLIICIKKGRVPKLRIIKFGFFKTLGVWEKILVGMCLLELLILAFICIIFPPRAYDSLWYHLPTVVQWISHQSILFQPNADIYSMMYPKNGEIFFLWNMIFVRSDLLVNLTQYIFLVLGIAALILIARELNLSLKNALWGTALFIFTPLSIIEASICYVDFILLFFMVAAFYFLLRFMRTNVQAYLLLLGVSCGFAMGTKYSGVYFVLLVAISLIIVLLMKKGKRFKRTLTVIGILTLFSLIFGGFWYVENLIRWNNPFWPIRISIGATTIFHGPKNILEAIIYGPSVSTPEAYSNWGFFFQGMLEKTSHFYGIYSVSWKGGFGPQFFAMGLISLFAVFIKSIISRNWYRLFFISFFVVLFLLSSVKIPRYNLYLIPLSCVSIGIVFEYISQKGLWKALIFFMVSYVFVMSLNHDFITPDLIKRGISLPVLEKRFLHACDLLRAGEENNELCLKFDKHIPGGSRVLTAGTSFPYLIAKNGFHRKLFYILPQDREKWYRKVDSLNIDYIIMKKSYHRTFDFMVEPRIKGSKLQDELCWIAKDTSTFSIVDSLESILLISIHKQAEHE